MPRMAPDIIDLVSSSPRHFNGAASPETKSSSTSGDVNPVSRKWSATSTRPTKKGSVYEDIEDSVFDLLDEPHLKRRKISGPEARHERHIDLLVGHQSASNSDPNPPPLMSHDRPLSRRPVLEPIEFTSSLEQTSPKASISLTTEQQPSPSSKHRGRPQAVNILGVEEDPFQSNPFDSPPKRFPGPQSRVRRAVSFDPFLSSSPAPRATAAQDGSNATRSHRPGLSKRPDTQLDQYDELDAFADSPPPQKRTSSGALADLICIDESSDTSGDSNDDELPSVADMDLTKRRARSPMRRTQSDTTWSKAKASRDRHAVKSTRPRKTAAEREAEKENKRREREQVKAAKAVEKHHAVALAEVNKLRTDKKVSTPEMIVDLPSGLDTGLQVQIIEMLQGLEVDHTTWSCPDHSMIKWRRKLTSRFNEDLGLWEPIAPRIVDEPIALVIFVAEEFVSLALEGALNQCIDDIKRLHAREKLIFMLQGMTAWTRKNRGIRNRSFASGVRCAGEKTASSSSSTTSRPRATPEFISEDVIEDAMLSLQVEHGILVHHTAAMMDTAKWVINFTQHISTIPYKKQKDEDTSVAGFCMESGQVRTGHSVQDTYIRMLQEIVRVTAPIAYGVAAEFNTVTKLVKGLECGGPERLVAVKKCTNKDGAVSDRAVGQAVSRRIYKVFTGTDENSTDV